MAPHAPYMMKYTEDVATTLPYVLLCCHAIPVSYSKIEKKTEKSDIHIYQISIIQFLSLIHVRIRRLC